MKIVIVGAFHEFIELAEDSGYEIYGLIDNFKKGEYLGYPIICADDEIDQYAQDLLKYPLIISPDKPAIREKLYCYYQAKGFRFPQLISQEAKISKTATINEGVVVQYGVNISSMANLGKFVKLNTNANIMHDTVLGDFTTIAPNAVVLGHVKIGNSCYVGANSTILPTINIGNNTIIGAGAVVTRDVEENSTYVGVPAKRIK
ncbi:MAG TPA: acetyltransferase [Candidatus Cloacimonadota bacterium]|nr:acetyltransferase [Candidatus Cloacimonadota bacterium]HOQ81119.1 acetyltransferase [Candidatus Cloacimonadota bacterium]